MIAVREAERKRLRLLVALGRARDAWPDEEECFVASCDDDGWLIEHLGLSGEQLLVDDVTFRAVWNLDWIELIPHRGYETDAYLVNITPEGDEIYRDEIAAPLEFLAELEESFIQLSNSLSAQFATQEDPTRAYESARAAFEHRIDRLVRQGFEVDHLRIPAAAIHRERRRISRPDMSAEWTKAYIEADLFNEHVYAALRYLESKRSQLSAGAPADSARIAPVSTSFGEPGASRPSAGGKAPSHDTGVVHAQVHAFISYSHRDEALRRQFASHISPLENQGLITAWHDRKIVGGEDWEAVLDEHLESAQIIIPLLSADFMASRYCYSRELKRALERHEVGAAVIVPVVLRPFDWHGEPIARLQMLPEDARAVTEWPNRDRAWRNVVQGIRRRLGQI